MRKRFNSAIAALLTMAIVCGCGASQQVSESATTKTDESIVVSEESQAKESIYPEYLNLESARPIVKDGEEITITMVSRRDSIANNDINETWFTKFVEEKLNVNLEIEEVNESTYQERRNLMLASNDMPDIMMNMGIGATDVVTYGVEGEQFLPMSDYINEELTPNIYKMLQENEDARVENTAPDGKMYTLPLLYANYPGFGDTLGTQRVFIDTKYMDAAGINEVPTTLDEFVEMLRAFKALDPAKMGVDEIWPIVSTWGNDKEILLNAFGWIGSNDVTQAMWDVETENVVIPCSQEKYADYITLLNALYTEGLIHPDFFTIDKTAARALYAEGKVPVIADAAVYLSIPDRFAEFESAVPLSSQWCENGVTKKTLGYSFGTVFISADTEYPEVCMRLLDYMYSDEGSVYSTWGPAEGSEDTMGLVEGIYLTEDGNIGYRDVESGKYESAFDYQVNAIEFSQYKNVPKNEENRILYAQKLLGVENPVFPELDMTNPDDHYRAICYEAHQGHMEVALPTAYLSPEQSSKIADLKSVIKNYVDAESAKFVVGQRPLSELDDYFKELQKLGIEEYIQLYQEIYKSYIETKNK